MLNTNYALNTYKYTIFLPLLLSLSLSLFLPTIPHYAPHYAINTSFPNADKISDTF